jgi:hypothetical protein
MARGTQLVQLVNQLKAETGHFTAVNAGVSSLDNDKILLQRTQELLYDDYDWPFMRIMPFTQLNGGQQYYDLPTDLNLERIELVQVWYGGQPHPIENGISYPEYAQYDSTSGVRCDPPRKWDIRWTGSSEQVEIWPIPAGNDQKLQWTGIRKLRPLVADGDVADLDDRLIVLFAAAEKLGRQNAKDAAAKAAAAQRRLEKLRGRVKNAERMVVMGGVQINPIRREIIIRVK